MKHRSVLAALVAALTFLGTHTSAHAQATQSKAQSAVSRLAGFKNLVSKAVRADASGKFRLQLNSRYVSASVFAVNTSTGTAWFGGIVHNQPARLSARTLSPGMANALGDVRFRHVAVLVAEQKASVPVASVPTELRLSPYASGGTLALEAGVNLFVSAYPGRNGVLGLLGKGLGLRGAIKIHGAAPPSAAAALFRSARVRTRGTAPSGPVALTVTLPRFSPQPFASLRDRSAFNVVFDHATLSLRGEGNTLTVTGSHSAAVTIMRKTARVSGAFTLTKTGRDYQIAISGKAALGRAAPSMLGFRMTHIGFDTTLVPGQTASFGLAADVQLPTRRTVTATASVVIGTDRRRRKRVEEVKLAINGSFSLRDLRVKLPGANQIRLSNPTIGFNTIRGDGFVAGDLEWRARGLKTSGVLFASRGGRGQRPGVALFMEMQQTSLKKLIRGLPRTADIPLPQAVLIMSTTKMANLPIDDLPSPAKAMMEKISSGTGATVTADDGVSIYTKLSTGPIAAFAKKLGVQGDLVIGGSIGGFAGGRPGFSLFADLPRFKLPPNMGAKFLALRSVKPKFFAMLTPAGGGNLSMGIELEAGVRIGRQTPVFAGKIFGTVGTKGASVNFSGKLKGLWRDPMGMKGIAFEDMVIGLGLGASASADIALGGKVRIGRLKYGMQGFVSLQVSPALGIPVPKAIGVNIKGNHLGMLTPFEIMDSFVYAAAHSDIANAIKSRGVQRALKTAARHKMASKVKAAMPIQSLSLRNFQIYFATPGASHPDLPELDGMGIKIKGQVYLGRTRLGSTDSFLKMPDGLKLDVRMNRFTVGPLRLNRSRLYLRVPIPGLSRELPQLEITGGGGIRPFTGSVTVGLGLKQAKFKATVNIGPLGSAMFEAKSIGGTVFKPRDFAINASIRGFDKGFRRALAGSLNAYIRNGPAQRALRGANKKVKRKKKALSRAIAAAKKDQKRAMRDIDKAKRNLNGIRAQISKMKRARKSYARRLKKAKVWNKPKWAAKVSWANTKLGTLYASERTAVGVLNAAKATVKIAPVHTNPKVIAAQSQYDAAVRDRALLTVSASAEREMGKFARTLMRAATRDFVLERVDLRNVRFASMTRGKAQTLSVQFRIKGKRFRHTFRLAMHGKWKLNFGQLPKKLVAVFKKK